MWAALSADETARRLSGHAGFAAAISFYEGDTPVGEDRRLQGGGAARRSRERGGATAL